MLNQTRMLFLTMVLLLSCVAVSHAIEVADFTHDSVIFNFSNARFVEYEGVESLSIDVEFEVRTTFLPRTVDIGNLQLIAYDANVENQIYATPSLFNSQTFGTIIRLTPEGGSKVKERSDLENTPVRSLEIESGKTHKGTLLFPLEEPYTLIFAVDYKGTRGVVRRAYNEYIGLSLEDLNYESVLSHLKQVKIPTEGDIILLNILRQMKAFENLNQPLKAAW